MYCLGGEFKYGKALWEEYKDEAEAADSRGLVLAHCRDSFRGSRCSILYQYTSSSSCYSITIPRGCQYVLKTEICLKHHTSQLHPNHEYFYSLSTLKHLM